MHNPLLRPMRKSNEMEMVGTYNDMWVVVDYKLFTPYQPLPDGVLWVGEQIPGDVAYSDETHTLRYGKSC